jgi:hypothetical protein
MFGVLAKVRKVISFSIAIASFLLFLILPKTPCLKLIRMAAPKKKKQTQKQKVLSPFEDWMETQQSIKEFEDEIFNQYVLVMSAIHPSMVEYRSVLLPFCEAIKKVMKVAPADHPERANLAVILDVALNNVMMVPGKLTKPEMKSFDDSVWFIRSFPGFERKEFPTWWKDFVGVNRLIRRKRFHIDFVLAFEQLTNIKMDSPNRENKGTLEYDEYLGERLYELNKLSLKKRYRLRWLLDDDRCKDLLDSRFPHRYEAWHYRIGRNPDSFSFERKYEDDFQKKLGEFRLKSLDAIYLAGDVVKLKELEPLLAAEFDIDPAEIEKSIEQDDRTMCDLCVNYLRLRQELIFLDPVNEFVDAYDVNSTYKTLGMKEEEWIKYAVYLNFAIEHWTERLNAEAASFENIIPQFLKDGKMLVTHKLLLSMQRSYFSNVVSSMTDMDDDFFF